MRLSILFAAVAVVFWGCDWTPDEVQVDLTTEYQLVNLSVGDTLIVETLGYALEIEETDTSSCLDVSDIGSGRISLVGLCPGKAGVEVRYQIPMIEGNDYGARLYLDVSISNGIPLSLYLGENLTVNWTDYLTAEQVGEIDSIAVQFPDDREYTGISIGFDGVGLHFVSTSPGSYGVTVVTFDDRGVQIASLLFETQTRIRKQVLAELFTNAGCVNCPVANENIDHLVETYEVDFTAIRYHVFWTDPNDPMNLYNPSEVENRRIFYGASWEAPRLVIKGSPVSDYGDINILGPLVRQMADESVDLYLRKPEFTNSTDSAFVEYTIQNFGPALDDLICWSVLTEDSIYYAGTNGETIHMQVMRDMSASSIPTLDAEQVIQHSLKLPPDYEASELFHLVTFVQNVTTREIIQTRDYSFSELAEANSDNP